MRLTRPGSLAPVPGLPHVGEDEADCGLSPQLTGPESSLGSEPSRSILGGKGQWRRG